MSGCFQSLSLSTWVALAAAVLVAGCAQESFEPAAEEAAPHIRIYAAGSGSPLAPASADQPIDILSRFLAKRGGGRYAGRLRAISTAQSPVTGLIHLRVEQIVGGLRVSGSYAKAALTEAGELIHVIDALVREEAAPADRPGKSVSSAQRALATAAPRMVSPAAPAAPAAIDARDALAMALAQLHMRVALPERVDVRATITQFARGTAFVREPSVERVALAVSGEVREGFVVETWSVDGNRLARTLVDGDGAVLSVEARTNFDQYNVFIDDPLEGAQTTVHGPGAGSAESPVGWLWGGAQTNIDISGNNAHAYLDANGDDWPDSNGKSVDDGRFLSSANLSQSPATAANRAVAVQNLFYLTNVIHDELYRHGFVEGFGNFQADNFGQGGLGGDAVIAEAQDGSGRSNANFATPPDGDAPRMQMYLWAPGRGRAATASSAAPDTPRDGDLDSDLVVHEYAHGLSWRLIEEMNGPLAGAVGEGVSDTVAFLLDGDDRFGEYVAGDPAGLRRYPYAGYPLAYADVSGGAIHDDGEIYAAAMYRVWELYRAAGYTRSELLDDLVQGMLFTPARPSFEQMRDGMLQAAAGSDRACAIWRGFADYGIGVGAQARLHGKSLHITESFAVPPACE